MSHFCLFGLKNLAAPRLLHLHFPHLPGRTKLAVVPPGGSALLTDLKTTKSCLFGARGHEGEQKHRIRTHTFTHLTGFKKQDLYEQ